MADVLQMKTPNEPGIQHYPEGGNYTKWGLGASILAHVSVILIVLILAYLNHIKSLADFMASSTAQPPPPTEVEVILVPDETPPPPTDHPLFIKQILQAPKPIIIPKPKPKPVPKPPTPIVQHHVESHVQSHAEAQLVVGSGGLAHPDYPFEMQKRHMVGTVHIRVTFDGSGHAVSAEIVSSSGYSALDDHTRSFILDNWVQKELAGVTQVAPIVYRPYRN